MKRLTISIILTFASATLSVSGEKPKAVEDGPAAKVVDSAFSEARRTSRLIFLLSAFRECLWCQIFDRYHDDLAVKEVMVRHFVVAKIDTKYLSDGHEVFSRYAQPGAPAWVVIDADRKVVLDPAKQEHGYSSFPTDALERERYLSNLQQAAPAIGSEEITVLREALLRFAPEGRKDVSLLTSPTAKSAPEDSARPFAVGDDFIPRDRWADMGSATPEAAAQTALWAGATGRTNRLKDLVLLLPEDSSSDFFEAMQRPKGTPVREGEELIGPWVFAKSARLVRRADVSPRQVQLLFHMDARPEYSFPARVVMLFTEDQGVWRIPRKYVFD
jgi:hypothetical protein